MDLKRSIAYLKQVWIDDTTPVDIELGPNTPCSIEYASDFSIFFLVDEGDSFTYVLNSDLEVSKMSLDQLRDIGVSNLRSIAEKIEIKQNDNVLYFVGNGNFEASLILVDEIWNEWLTEYCPNGYIAALPARDILAVIDRDNKESFEKLTKIIDNVWNGGDHLLTKSLFERTANIWVRLQDA